MLKHLVGKACVNPTCKNRSVLVSSDLHVCDICAEPVEAVREWNKTAIGTLVLGAILCGGVGLYLKQRSMAPPPLPLPEPVGSVTPLLRELELAFELEIPNDSGGTVAVLPNYVFRSGDRFRVVLKPSFEGRIYLFNQNPRDERVSVLYPATPSGVTVQAHAESRAPSDDGWFLMDDKSGSEVMILVASPSPLPKLTFDNGDVDRHRFESWLAETERDGKPKSQQVFQDGVWTKLMADASQTPLVFVHRVPLKHE